MLFKEVKQYSNRQRIDLNKKDNLKHGAKVVILTDNEYNDMKKELLDLQEQNLILENQNQLKKDQEQNIKEIIENVTAPIYEHHKKELENKDLEIKHLTNELNTIRKSCSQYNMELMDLNLIDMVFRSKHKDLIKEFNNSIFLDVENVSIDADIKAINGSRK